MWRMGTRLLFHSRELALFVFVGVALVLFEVSQLRHAQAGGGPPWKHLRTRVPLVLWVIGAVAVFLGWLRF